MQCDPLHQNCASALDGCYPGASGPGCYPAGAIPLGDMCTYSNDCLKGSACVGSAGMTTCRQLCSYPGGAPGCDAGTCTRLTSSMAVGVCL
jgi:hypothetical protein